MPADKLLLKHETKETPQPCVPVSPTPLWTLGDVGVREHRTEELSYERSLMFRLHRPPRPNNGNHVFVELLC